MDGLFFVRMRPYRSCGPGIANDLGFSENPARANPSDEWIPGLGRESGIARPRAGGASEELYPTLGSDPMAR